MGKNKPSKLVLNRETVRDLTNAEMQNVEGAGNQPFSKGQVCPIGTNSGDPCADC